MARKKTDRHKTEKSESGALDLIGDGLDHLTQGITIFDRDLNMVAWNRTVQEVLGLPEGFFKRGANLEDFFRFNAERGEYGPGNVEQQVAERIELAKSFKPHRFERVRPNGTILEIEGNPLPRGGFVTTYTDITKRKKEEQALKEAYDRLDARVEERTRELKETRDALAEERQLLEATLENISQGITMIDQDMIMAVCNRRFHELMDIPPYLSRGNHFADFMRYNAERGEYGPGNIEQQVAERVELAKKRTPHCFQRERPDGTTIEVRGTPLENGSFVSTYTDITAFKKIEKELREYKERYELAAQGANDGLWDWELGKDRFSVSPSMRNIKGLEEWKETVASDSVLKFIHPDYREHYLATLRDLLRGKSDVFFCEYRLNTKDGQTVWVRNRGAALRNEEGRVYRMAGSISDITLERQTQEDLRQALKRLERHERELAGQSRLLQTTLENISQGISMFDENLNAMVLNRKFKELLNFPDELLKTGTHLSEFFRYNAERGEYGDGDIDELVDERIALAKESEAHRFRRERPDGSVIEVVGTPLKEGGFVTTYEDVTLQVRAEEAIKASEERAARANRAKSEFLSSMSHELRTPLNAILGFAQLMEFNPKAPLNEQQAGYIENILHAGNHLLELINEVLDLAKIESGNISLSPEPIKPTDIANECLKLIAPQADARGIRLVDEISYAAPLPAVHADFTRLKQILVNLLSNAVKYNRENGTITFSCSPHDNRYVRFSIADTGYGIPDSKMADLFQPFNRLGAENSEIEGTGIGLTLTQKLVQMMGGDIGLTSVVDEGTTFWIDIPKSRQGAQKTKDIQSSSADKIPSILPGQHTVLYVEDNPANLTVMEEIFDRFPNTNLKSAHNGLIGLERARSLRPDLIILDIHLPDINGYELLTRLKLYDETRHIPVIALSANAMPKDIERGRNAGFLDYLTKPLNIQVIIEAINRALADSK